MNGTTQEEVASLFKIAQISVSYIWRKYLKTKSLEDKERFGRPLKTTTRDQRMLITSRMLMYNIKEESIFYCQADI